MLEVCSAGTSVASVSLATSTCAQISPSLSPVDSSPEDSLETVKKGKHISLETDAISPPDCRCQRVCLVGTYLAVSTVPSSREALLSRAPREDSSGPPARGGSITAASDVAVGSHAVTERGEQALLCSVYLTVHLLSTTSKVKAYTDDD